MQEIENWREQLSASSAVWAADDGFTSEPGCCTALSGASSPEYNVVYCYGGDAEKILTRAVSEAPKRGMPRLVTIVGEPLGWVQILVDDGWTCVGAAAALHVTAASIGRDAGSDPSVRRLGPDGLAVARGVLQQAFGGDPRLAEMLVPDRLAEPSATGAVWALDVDGEIVSIAVAAGVSDSTCVWSMSTPPKFQGRGYGRRLLRGLIAEARASGSEHILLFSNRAGVPICRSVGFEVTEHWQQWSRPRWLFGRS
jgi:GNAT superfamily N-acetyltransferase